MPLIAFIKVTWSLRIYLIANQIEIVEEKYGQ